MWLLEPPLGGSGGAAIVAYCGGSMSSRNIPRDWWSAIEPCKCMAFEQARQKCISQATQYSTARATSHSVQRCSGGLDCVGSAIATMVWRVNAPLAWRVVAHGAQ